MTSFVYFDLGGVINRDFTGRLGEWIAMKRELGITPDQDNEFDAFWKHYEPEVCAGRDTETLLPLIKEKFDAKIPDGYSLLIDGFVNRFEANKSIWPIIEKVRQSARVGLLTNMAPGMLQAIKSRNLLPNVSWDVIIDSSVEGIKKPDPEIFELAEEKAKAKGKDILFVENTPANLEATHAFGWQTFFYDSTHPEIYNPKLLALF